MQRVYVTAFLQAGQSSEIQYKGTNELRNFISTESREAQNKGSKVQSFKSLSENMFYNIFS